MRVSFWTRGAQEYPLVGRAHMWRRPLRNRGSQPRPLSPLSIPPQHCDCSGAKSLSSGLDNSTPMTPAGVSPSAISGQKGDAIPAKATHPQQ